MNKHFYCYFGIYRDLAAGSASRLLASAMTSDLDRNNWHSALRLIMIISYSRTNADRVLAHNNAAAILHRRLSC